MDAVTALIDCSDAGALSALYKQLGPIAISKTQYIVNDVAIAQDIVHDVFTKLWESRSTFTHIKAAYQWVYVSCHNASIDYLRSQRRRSQIANSVVPLLIPHPTQPDERLSNRQFLLKAMNLLDERETSVLAFVVIDGFTQKQIADVLNVSEKTIQRVVASIESKLKTTQEVFYVP